MPNLDIRIEQTKKLLGFAAGVLTARDKVQMRMDQTRMGVFRETEIVGLPGLSIDVGDGTWLRLKRQTETRPDDPEPYIKTFLADAPVNPDREPELVRAVTLTVALEEASDLEEAGLLRSENANATFDNGTESEDDIRVTLLADDLPELQAGFDLWVVEVWSPWAERERPIRRSIALYNALFRIHAAVHASDGAPPEIVWGFGLGTWKTGADTIDMPLVEQEVEIEIESGGELSLTPRERPPELTLRPYIDADITGSHRLQGVLAEAFAALRQGDTPFSPSSFEILEPVFEQVASKLDSNGRFVSLADRAAGSEVPRPSEQLHVISAWAMYGRPRSSAARVQDLEALAQAMEDDGRVPEAIEGFVAPEPDRDIVTDPFGFDPTVLSAGASSTGHSSGAGNGAEPGMPADRSSASDRQSRAKRDEKRGAAYFFPLPFNEEQSRIVDALEGRRGEKPAPVVSVTGPPGTGKSHTIANLVSHAMACGHRVLVTARTAEAIAVVRDKLPKSLQSLVIESTGTDRQSIEQLKAAVSELSDEIVSMDETAAQRERAEIEAEILQCDEVAREADVALAKLAKVNLEALPVGNITMKPMELVDHVAEGRAAHGWFTDRPKAPPTDETRAALERLGAMLPAAAPDIDLIGLAIPTPEALPSTQDLLAAHKAELSAAARPRLDPSSFPPMVIDSDADVERAKYLLDRLHAVEQRIAEASSPLRAAIADVLGADSPDSFEDLLATLANERLEPCMTSVRYDGSIVPLEDLRAAAVRGACGQKVAPGFLNRALKRAVATILVDDAPPDGKDNWQIVERTMRLESAVQGGLGETLQQLPLSIRPDVTDTSGWVVAGIGLELISLLTAALHIQQELSSLSSELESLFPTGLDLPSVRRGELMVAKSAIQAHLPDSYVPHPALATLDAIGERSTHPLFARLKALRAALGASDTMEDNLVRERADLTQELKRLASLRPTLESLQTDLDALAAIVPKWAERLRAAPQDAPHLIPEGWPEAWSWAALSGKLEKIVRLGNGDALRKHKEAAVQRREQLMVRLIRVRTMLGLKARMTASIQRAMHAFTQAVARVGKGTGKTAPRFRRAAQAAAREVSVAAPVWIMPEHRIAEQLPPELEAFDLVILDEASQSDITAVTALARGKQILVVGDEEQVSPSNVGIPSQRIDALRAEYLTDLPNANLVDENTSIFEITMRMFPHTHIILREHFRSVAPIIQFSTQFYNNRLIPLRMPKASERFDPPLVDVFIDRAARKAKTNPAEARFIVDEIARILADPDHARRDVGVVSLIGSDQAALIQTMLIDDQRVGPEKMAERRIICGDARTMQGQERSVMFLSMVATPDAVTAQTAKDTQQRLNVAMSRARDRVYLVHSVRAEHLKSADLKRRVLEHFLDPMPEGRKETSPDLMARCDSDFEQEVLGMLLDAGYRARPQVAAGAYRIDIVVEGADDRRLAIELDGDRYHGPERWAHDMARQSALERAGWVFWRVFGSQWKAERDTWWQDLCSTLERMHISPLGAEAVNDAFVENRYLDAADILPNVAAATADEDNSSRAYEHQDENAFGARTGTPSDFAPLEADPVLEEVESSRESLQFEFPQPAVEPNGSGIEPHGYQDTAADPTELSKSENFEAGIGALVRLETADGRLIQVTIVGKENHNTSKGLLGAHMPLAQALEGAVAGDEVEYQAGSYLRTVKVLNVMQSAGAN